MDFSLLRTILAGTNVVHISGIGCIYEDSRTERGFRTMLGFSLNVVNICHRDIFHLCVALRVTNVIGRKGLGFRHKKGVQSSHLVQGVVLLL